MTNTKIVIKKVNKIYPQLISDLVLLVKYLYEYKRFSVKKCLLWTSKILKNPEADLFIAFDQKPSKTVGMLNLVSYPTVGGYNKYWIEEVCVDKNYQNQGIGKKLVLKALKQAKKEGAKEVNLTSNPKRISANHLYQKLGFEIYNTNVYRYHFS